MIRNQWYAVLESGEIKAGKMTGVTRLGERLVFWKNNNNEIVCLKDKCAHRGASLARGKHHGDTIACPFHGSGMTKQGYKTLVNGPVALSKDNQLEFWVYNEKDIGQTPKKAERLPPPDEYRPHLHFIFSNIWQNYVSKPFRVFVAFVPVDESNTVIYLRNYQRLVNVPVLQELTD
jgi:phenylpropionate dioxygenase-like ring-hydroxylating dioxygenase large terminal subunit